MEWGTSSALTVESVRLALGAASLRQRVIADNIANASSPDHVRMRVVFEARLADALASARMSAGDDIDAMPTALDGVRAEVLPEEGGSAKVELDDEMAQLSANSLRYHALTKGLSRYLSIAGAISAASKG